MTMTAKVAESSYLVIVGPSFPRRCLFGTWWTISHAPSSSLSQVSIEVVHSHSSFFRLHLLLLERTRSQVDVWATGIIILFSKKKQFSAWPASLTAKPSLRRKLQPDECLYLLVIKYVATKQSSGKDKQALHNISCFVLPQENSTDEYDA